MDDDERCPSCIADGETEPNGQARRFGIDEASEDGGETDAELEEWLAARMSAWEEQRWALADQEVEGW